MNIPLNKKHETQPLADTAKTNSNLFAYNAIIKAGNEYMFTVSNADTLNFDLWKADVTLHPSSYVEVVLTNNEFLPKAHLNGEMTMNIGLKDGQASDDKNKNVRVPKVAFQGLEVQTVRPYIKVGAFSLGSEGEGPWLGGFPISLNEIYGSSNNGTIELGLDITL